MDDARPSALYSDLRRLALTAAPADGAPDVFGIVMETGTANGAHLLVAFSWGDASLYLESGGGVIGGAGHRPIQDAARHAVVVASRHAAAFVAPPGDAPVPAGQCRFVLRRRSGDLAGQAAEDALSEGNGPLSDVFHAMHAVLTRMRILWQKSDSLGDAVPAGRTPPWDKQEYLRRWLELMEAMEQGDLAAMDEAFQRGADAIALDASGRFPLLAMAVLRGDLAVAQRLIAHGAAPNPVIRRSADPNDPQASLLHFVVGQSDVPSVTFLLDAGAPPEAADKSGTTPLMVAAYTGRCPAIECLLERGAAIDARDASGYTALMMAANAGHAEAVALLLRRGSDVNARDAEKSTPLMFAAQHGHEAVVRGLLAAGADRGARGAHGLSAADLAKQNGHAGTLEILRASA